jgi:hypothetical protein
MTIVFVKEFSMCNNIIEKDWVSVESLILGDSTRRRILHEFQQWLKCLAMDLPADIMTDLSPIIWMILLPQAPNLIYS